MSAPYLLRWYDHTAYHVVDRGSGDQVGYVVAWARGWQGYKDQGREVGPLRRYRKDAAEDVWSAS